MKYDIYPVDVTVFLGKSGIMGECKHGASAGRSCQRSSVFVLASGADIGSRNDGDTNTH